jgi:thiamine biosynthesis lipoprotein
MPIDTKAMIRNFLINKKNTFLIPSIWNYYEVVKYAIQGIFYPFIKGGKNTNFNLCSRGILLLVLLCTISCSNKPETFTAEKILMGTTFKIKASLKTSKQKKLIRQTCQKAFEKISRLENQMSVYKPNSIVSLVNKNAGIKPITVTNEIMEVVNDAFEISNQSEGVFDITFGPLGKLWNIKHRKVPPDAAEIEQAKKLVNYKKIVLNKQNKTLFLKDKEMSIGLGAIAKGYAAGKAAEILKNNGFENFIINAGGDLYYSGKKDKEFWTSAIQNPDSKSDFILKFKVKTDTAVVTSGDYQRFFKYKSKKYHHIINPNTGYPAWGVKSVTVFTHNPAIADGWATAFFIMGQKKSLEITEKNPNIAFVMVDSANRILKSPNLNKFIEIF